MNHKLDTDRQVFFYEQEFYVLSNFSAFRVKLLVDDGSGGEIHCTFDTSEAAYHWFKFPHLPELQAHIRAAQSAHDAFKLAEQYRERRRPDWDAVKVDVMREILHAKVDQHEYVRRKLLETGDRELIEDSWRDDFWGWGPNRDGENMLGDCGWRFAQNFELLRLGNEVMKQKPRMRLRDVFQRANSTLVYWNYRRHRPNPISLWWALGEWFRRWRFEFETYLSELR